MRIFGAFTLPGQDGEFIILIPGKYPVFGKYIYLKSVSENWGYDGKEGKGRGS